MITHKHPYIPRNFSIFKIQVFEVVPDIRQNYLCCILSHRSDQIFKISNFLKINTKHIQGVFAQIHNSLLVGKHMHEQLINLIFNNHHFILRYELIKIHQDILDGKPLSTSLARLLSQEYSVLAALMVEAEKGNGFENAIHEISNAITRLSQQKTNLFNLFIPTCITFAVSLYFAFLLASLYIAPRVAVINIVGGEIPFFISIYQQLFNSSSSLYYMLTMLVAFFVIVTCWSLFRSTKFYPRLFYLIELYIPVLGNMQKSLCSLLLIRSLAIGFKSNLRMINIIHQAAIHNRHKVLKNRLYNVIDSIKNGELPIIAVTKSKLLPFRYRYLFNQLLREADSSTGINNILRLGESEIKRFYVLIREGTRATLYSSVIAFNLASLWAYIYTSIEYGKYTI